MTADEGRGDSSESDDTSLGGPTRWQSIRAGLLYFGILGAVLAVVLLIVNGLTNMPRGTVTDCEVEAITTQHSRFSITQYVDSSCGRFPTSDHLKGLLVVGQTYDFVLVGTANGRIDQATPSVE